MFWPSGASRRLKMLLFCACALAAAVSGLTAVVAAPHSCAALDGAIVRKLRCVLGGAASREPGRDAFRV